MNNSGKYYNGYDDEKLPPDSIYSSKDYVPGKLGALVKLLTGFIIYVMSLSIQTVFFSPYIYFNEMYFIMFMSAIMLFVVWGSAVLLKKRKNILKILVILAAIAISFFFSPYSKAITFSLLAAQLITAFTAFSRMNLPEKIGLSATLIIGSSFLFCVLQIIFAFSQFKNDSSMQLKSIITIVGIVWIIISIFMLNIIHLKRLSDTNKKISRGLLYGNITLTVLFAGLTLIISSVNIYKDMIVNIFRNILLFILKAINYIMGMLFSSDGQIDGNMDITPISDIREQTPTAKFMENVIIILIISIIAISLFISLKRIFKALISGIRRLIDYLKRSEIKSGQFAFTDVEESTFDKKQLNKAMQNRLKNFARRFKRKLKLSDMANNNEKVRLIYKFILQKKEENGEDVCRSTTAREMLTSKNPSNQKVTFLDGYEKARYSNHEVSDEEVEAGIAVLNSK